MSAETQGNTALDAALFYARLGWSVVPSHFSKKLNNGETACSCSAGSGCISPGKHPALPSWKAHTESAATPDQIQEWFTGSYKGYGVGIITGKVSGIFVVDVDTGPGKVGGDSLDALQVMHDDLPHTIEARTGGGGRHIILKHPGDFEIATVKNTPAPGIDIRGDGGFIVTAPSMHTSGRPYLWNEHHHPQNTAIAEAPAWLLEQVKSDGPRAGSSGPSTGTGEIVRDAWGKVVDGRERHMIGIIAGVVASHLKKSGIVPKAEVIFDEAWPSYERTTRARGVSLEADHRGESLMRQRIQHTLRRIATGKWKIAKDHPQLDSASEQPDKSAGDPEDIFPTLDIQGLLALPPVEWLISGILTTDGFSVPYGPPGSLKTFVVLDWSLCICSGLPWHGKPVKQGTVLYVAAEGVRGIARRVRAWQIKRNLDGVDLPFRLLPASVDMTQPAEVAKLVRTAVAAARTEGCPIALVVIDTVARAIPGADENSAQDMGRFVAAVETVKAGVTCHVLGVHHSGKDEERGARGSNSLLGAVDTMIRVKRDGDNLTLTVEKQKDEDEGEPIELKIEKVEWLEGLRQSGSLVLVPNTDKNPRMAEVDLVMVATVIGPNGRMTTRKLGEALGAKAGRQTYEMANSIPFYPDYARVDLPEGTVKVFRARTGKASNSPIDVVRSDQEEA